MSERTVLVVLDAADDALRSPALEALTLARSLGEPVAFTVHEPSETTLVQLGEHGVARVVLADVGDAPTSVGSVVGQAVAAGVRLTSATVVLLTSSFANKEVAAHAAWLTGAGLIVDVAHLEVRDGHVVGGKRVFAGTWDTECVVSADVAVVTVRANAVSVEAAEVPVEPVVQGVVVDATVPPGMEVVDRVLHEAAADASGVVRPALGEAAIVVAGGRGTAGDFGPVTELADVLGAAVGTTRDVVDEGWLGHDAQIGQTGVTIAPRVYIGAGISGAPHHHGGMQASGTIIAVNNDAEAPLFEIADFGVVGDLHDVLPAAAAAIREHRASRAGQ